MIKRAFRKRLCCGRTVFCKNVFFKRTAVDTDSNGNTALTASIGNHPYSVTITDISRIDADLIHACVKGGKRVRYEKLSERAIEVLTEVIRSNEL